jgi:alkaline phosphatase D
MITRRSFLLSSSGVVLLTSSLGHARTDKYPFTLGVASGCPRESSVVLWTRLAPAPLEGGGMPPEDTAVRYRICRDPGMKQAVRDGVYVASEQWGHSVHVRVDGLEPGREYWYQFHCGEDDSPIGRTRTASVDDAAVRLAVASCQHYETGYFSAYADMAQWAPDCVIHVGDYIYEGAANAAGNTVRRHNGAEIVTLWDYRNRHALYRSDPQLQAAHAASPWIMAMDDHEIDNNWAGETPQDPWAQTRLEFSVRKLAALQAYYEHMPLERPPTLRGVDAELRLYNAFRFGPAQVHLLDTRQYRSDQACGDGTLDTSQCEQLQDPTRTITGAAQEAWLLGKLGKSQARYNVLAQQTWFSPYRYNPRSEPAKKNVDQWDGYPLQRQRIIDALATVQNPVVLSGDWHCGAAMAIHRDPDDPKSPRVGYEFTSTSISSRCGWADNLHNSKGHNPHAMYVNADSRGYLRCIADAKDWTAQFRVVADPSLAGSPVRTDFEAHTRES